MEPSNAVRTLVLVGRTGNGKSATGNSILRKKAFDSRNSSIGVTLTGQMETAVLEDGMRLNVIDTPGLFDASAKAGFINKKIGKCIQTADDGIHAFLIVLSVRNCFSNEEKSAFHSLKELFGDKVVNYAIIVFTNGDELDEYDETLDDYLHHNSTGPLKEFLQMCGNRCVLFNNQTRDESKKNEQLRQLLCLVNRVVDENDGQPYTNDLFVQFKIEDRKDKTPRHGGGVEDDHNHAQVKLKLKETTGRLDQQLDDTSRESKNKLWDLNEKIEDRKESKNKIQKLEDRRESKNKIRELNEKIEDQKEKTPRHGGGVKDYHNHAQMKLKLKETTRRLDQQLDDALRESKNKIQELNEKIEDRRESKNKIWELNEKIEDRKENTPRHRGGVEDDHIDAQVKLKLKETARRQDQQLENARRESENKIRELNEKIENIKKTPCDNCSIV